MLQCMPADGCATCVASFSEKEGCSAMEEKQDSVAAFLRPDCMVCAEVVRAHCAGESSPSCEPCKEVGAFFDSDGCAELVRGERSVPERCHDCRDVALSWCGHRFMEEEEGCHTAEVGESCFAEVRWAMEHGIFLRPDWYPSLNRSSSFEAFQEVVHARKVEVCQVPCSGTPLTPCHTASPGEECYRHALWAREVGIRLHPAIYPEWLSNQSSLKGFQNWLHRIHHGSCPPPCE